MTRIIVEDVYDFEQLNTLLTFTLEQVRNGVAYDLIIIDSMTALFYLLSPSNDGYNDYKLGMAEISKIVILLKELAANNITIVTTNTPTESTQNEEDLNEGDEEDEEDEVANYSSSQDSEVTEPEGGKFWESVPSIRIALTALDEDKDFDSENECLLRKIKVVKATFCPSNNKEAFVHISNAGVTSFVDDYSK